MVSFTLSASFPSRPKVGCIIFKLDMEWTLARFTCGPSAAKLSQTRFVDPLGTAREVAGDCDRPDEANTGVSHIRLADTPERGGGAKGSKLEVGNAEIAVPSKSVAEGRQSISQPYIYIYIYEGSRRLAPT